MIKCLFVDTLKEYHCDYSIENGRITVKVDYNLDNEIEKNSCDYAEENSSNILRDIIIMDQSNNYLIKNAHYEGLSSKYGPGLCYELSIFKSNMYIMCKDINKLLSLKKEPRYKKIIIESDELIQFVKKRSIKKRTRILKNKQSMSEIINISFAKKDKRIHINKGNINNVYVGERVYQKDQINNIQINEYGCIEVEFKKGVKYKEFYECVNELLLYLRLYANKRISIKSIFAKIDNNIFAINDAHINAEDIENRNLEISVEDDIGKFIKRCYQKIDYRHNNNNLRNIYSIINYQKRNIEDDFLLYYRFIECFYKSNNTKEFLVNSIKEHWNKFSSDIEVLRFAAEVSKLRNHYAHSGYHIKGNTLKISGKNFGIDDYVVNNVDIRWIYNKTCILYKIVIDIIFKTVLGYSKYSFAYKYNENNELINY